MAHKVYKIKPVNKLSYKDHLQPRLNAAG